MRSTLTSIGRYWHTLRHLLPVQFYGRLWFRLARPRPDRSPAPRRRAVSGVWVQPARRSASLDDGSRFSFLNEAGRLEGVGWDGPERSKLWRYNQHYFDDLNALDAPSRGDWHLALLQNWVARNPPGAGSGWEPYPTSLRIVNWVKWALGGNALPDSCHQSLAVQARWLARRLEWHLLGNHLFANAKALVFAGLYFEGVEARRWLETGCRILQREVPEQILPDGGHFERSTMYHALALEDMLDLANVAAAFPEALSEVQRELLNGWAGRIPAMQRWLHAMCHPDGGIAFFNDAAFGIAPAPAEIDAYADRLGYGGHSVADDSIIWLRDSGYARLNTDQAVALLDLAPVGPDYLPGHAHADTLSFEFSVFGRRIFVNSGTSEYGGGWDRLRQRGTAAHNTVVVGGEDSSEVWGGFRVARRARLRLANVECTDDALVAEGAHDGYCRLPGRPEHYRRWRLSPGRLTVEDHVTDASASAEARFHLHPEVAVRQAGSGHGACLLPDGRSLGWRVEGGAVRLEPASWHPAFGISRPTSCIVVPLQEGRCTFQLNWA